MSRSPFGWLPLLLALALPAAGADPDYRVELSVLRSGLEGNLQWSLPLAGVVPGNPPVIVVLLGKAVLGVSDVYLPPSSMESRDLGRTWSDLRECPGLQRHREANGATVAILGTLPVWHARQRRLLAIGTTSHFVGNGRMTDPPESPAYSLYDPDTRAWSPWRTMAMPAEEKFYFVSPAGTQRVDLENGNILLPAFFKAKGPAQYSTTVLRCTFDGANLAYLDHGDELTLPFDPHALPPNLSAARRWFISRQAGFFEPQLAFSHRRYFLTMRNVKGDYVTRGDDGLHFEKPRPWVFDDGGPLGSENTQTRWVTHGDGLFLVYTRRGANNDHIFRHRAPLFMARVDPDRLCVLRGTERILVPEHGASLGNFNVTEISAQETWVTTFEDMNSLPPSARANPGNVPGRADNRAYAARILWR